MKLFYTLTGLAAVAHVHGSPRPDGKQGGRKLGQAKGILSIMLGISEPDAKSFLRNYGCYCYPLMAQKAGPAFNYNGDPVDELDDLCKKLYRAQKCIDIDVADGVYETACDVEQGYGFFQKDGDIVCGAEENQDKDEKVACRINMCELEKDFASKVAALVNSGFTHTESYKNMNEAQYQATCQKTKNNSGSETELSCCGEGIARRTYNTITSECCDNRVESLGSC